MSCKTIAYLQAIVTKPSDDIGMIGATKSALNIISDIDESHIRPTDLSMLSWLVGSLIVDGHVALLGDIHTEPDCAICVALSRDLRRFEAEKLGHL